eukprot:652794-Pleurochrysis_carterae.AAC.3
MGAVPLTFARLPSTSVTATTAQTATATTLPMRLGALSCGGRLLGLIGERGPSASAMLPSPKRLLLSGAAGSTLFFAADTELKSRSRPRLSLSASVCGGVDGDVDRAASAGKRTSASIGEASHGRVDLDSGEAFFWPRALKRRGVAAIMACSSLSTRGMLSSPTIATRGFISEPATASSSSASCPRASIPAAQQRHKNDACGHRRAVGRTQLSHGEPWNWSGNRESKELIMTAKRTDFLCRTAT